MIPESIKPHTIEEIYGKYWGCPCKFKNDEGRWTLGRVGERTIKAVRNRECTLLLKPISAINEDVIKHINNVLNPGGVEEDITPEDVQDFIRELTDSLEYTSYVTVDILRRKHFHVPIYNLDLFKCGVAEPINERIWNEYIEQKKSTKKLILLLMNTE